MSTSSDLNLILPEASQALWGYFACFRLYSPLQPFFDKTWRPSEIELVSQ